MADPLPAQVADPLLTQVAIPISGQILSLLMVSTKFASQFSSETALHFCSISRS